MAPNLAQNDKAWVPDATIRPWWRYRSARRSFWAIALPLRSLKEFHYQDVPPRRRSVSRGDALT